jgi:chemotaxis protein CheX
MILDSLILQIKLFLQGDMDIEITKVEVMDSESQKLALKDYTSMIGVGGKLSLIVAISYDLTILDALVDVFMDGEKVEDEELEDIRNSVAGETINTIMGLSLPTFPNRGKGVTITPPIAINDASNLTKHRNSKIVSATITTNYGIVIISAIGTQDSI